MNARHTVKPKPPVKHTKAKKVDALAELMGREKDPELIEMTALEKDDVRWRAYVAARCVQRKDSKSAAAIIHGTPPSERFFRELVAALDREPGSLLTDTKLRIVNAWRVAYLRLADTPAGYDVFATPSYTEVKEEFKRMYGGKENTNEEREWFKKQYGGKIAIKESAKEVREQCLPSEQYFRDTLKEFGLPLRSSRPGRKKVKETKKILSKTPRP